MGYYAGNGMIKVPQARDMSVILNINKKKRRICEKKLRRTRQLSQSIMEIYAQES